MIETTDIENPSEVKVPTTATASHAQRIRAVVDDIRAEMAQNPTTLIPLTRLLTLHGKPYSLHNHFTFEPFFKRALPKAFVAKCGRQVSKSTNIAASGVLRHAGMSYLRSLFMTPLCNQVRRLSSEYVRPFIQQSILRDLLVDEGCTQAVFQRSFANYSTMYFSFAFLDAERIRGISCDMLNIDEVQDLDYDFIPVILECMSASSLALEVYTGTPKTLDNTIEALWQSSSKGEWVTRCDACNHWNMAALHADLERMIGKTTVVCARCSKPINPATGHWYHTDPEKEQMVGYHVPQILLPMHYSVPDKWQDLLAKRDGRKAGYTQKKFLNEVLGESCDMGTNLVTITDIKKASSLSNHNNEFKTAAKLLRSCPLRVLGIDWGGGGDEEVSYTVVTLCGITPGSSRITCFYCERFPISVSIDVEISTIIRYFKDANMHFIAHDFGGAGGVREAMLIQAGLPIDRVHGIMYTYAPTKHVLYFHTPDKENARGYYMLDKTRSLVLQASCVKAGMIAFPNYEQSKEVTHDMLNLIEDRHEVPRSSDVLLIKRRPKSSDDFAHSLNYACALIWHQQQRWPNLSEVQNLQLTRKQLEFAAPPGSITGM